MNIKKKHTQRHKEHTSSYHVVGWAKSVRQAPLSTGFPGKNIEGVAFSFSKEVS